jgi:adenylylsulfate reductase subunit A
MIHGESYKPIVAEAAKKSAGQGLQPHLRHHLLMDESKPNRVAGAVGFNVRTGNYHVFKSKTVICGAGGASNIFKPRSTGEGAGRTWYAPWSSASAYGLHDRRRREDDADGEPDRAGALQGRLWARSARTSCT